MPVVEKKYQFRAIALVLQPHQDVELRSCSSGETTSLRDGQVFIWYEPGLYQVVDRSWFVGCAHPQVWSVGAGAHSGTYLLRSGDLVCTKQADGTIVLAGAGGEDPHSVTRERFKKYYVSVGEASAVIDVDKESGQVVDRFLQEYEVDRSLLAAKML